jgi:hypothetical protein
MNELSYKCHILMKIIEKIKEVTTIQIISSLSGVLILLIWSIYQDVLPLILPTIIQQLPKIVLLKGLIIISAFILLLVALSLSLYLKLKTKLTPKFGIFWDKNKEPYCPACEKPLSQYGPYNIPNTNKIVYSFRCVKCDKHISLTYNGNYIKLEDAKKLL